MNEYQQKITRIYNAHNIQYWTKGKNVTTGWVNIQCPFCNDVSNHCGLDPKTLIYHCWKCNTTGSFDYLLMHLLNISQDQAEGIVSELDIDFKIEPLEQIRITRDKTNQKEKNKKVIIEMPEFSLPVTHNLKSRLLDLFLQKRKYTREHCIKYKCCICEEGDFCHRLIIPVFSKGDLVSYQGADMTGRSGLKYMTAEGDINNFLYGYDYIKKKMIVVEGVFDDWRMEHNVVASFGTSLTDIQRQLILDKNLDQLIFGYDSGAYWEARKQAAYFEPFVKIIIIINFPLGEDPDSYGRQNTMALIEKEMKK